MEAAPLRGVANAVWAFSLRAGSDEGVDTSTLVYMCA